jgi:hypothetical protein
MIHNEEEALDLRVELAPDPLDFFASLVSCPEPEADPQAFAVRDRDGSIVGISEAPPPADAISPLEAELEAVELLWVSEEKISIYSGSRGPWVGAPGSPLVSDVLGFARGEKARPPDSDEELAAWEAAFKRDSKYLEACVQFEAWSRRMIEALSTRPDGE